MEEKKGYKIGLMPLILLILNIILIIVIIVMGFYIHNKNKENNSLSSGVVANTVTTPTMEKPEPTNDIDEIFANIIAENIQNAVENVSDSSTNNATTIDASTKDEYTEKNVENRPYIYDAQYFAEDINTNSYSSSDGNQYSISDICVPYINMKSDDADKMNSEIENYYKNFVQEFKVCSQNLNSYIKVNYETHITSNIYSILLTITRGQENNKTEEYVAYNFDIMSGTKLDYNQVCYVAGVQNSNESVHSLIYDLKDYNSYVLTASKNVSKQKVEERNAQIEACKAQTFTNYQEDLLNNVLVYFLDDNLKLNISVRLVFPDISKSGNKLMIVES